MFRLSDGEEIMTLAKAIIYSALAFFVLIQYRSVTDRRTDRQTYGQTDIPSLAIPALAIACYATALVKLFKIQVQNAAHIKYLKYNYQNTCLGSKSKCSSI